MEPNDLASGFIAFALFLLGGIALVRFTKQHRGTLRPQILMFATALLIRFALSIVLYGFGFVSVIGDDDSSGWLMGVMRTQEWQQEGVTLDTLPIALLKAFEGTNRGYSYLIGAFFYVTNAPYRLPVAALSCFCGALTVVLVYRIAELLFSPWVATRAGWWSCLMPSLLIWSSQTVKEPIVILLETLLAYICLRFRHRQFAFKYIAVIVVSLACLMTLRFYAAYVGFIMVGFSVVIPKFQERRMTVGLAMKVVLVAIPLTALTAYLLQNELAAQKLDLDMVIHLKHGLATTANTGVESSYEMRTPGGFVMATVVGTLHLLLAPFPWHWGEASSLRMILTVPETVVWWVLFFAGVIPGLRYAVRDKFGEIIPLLVLVFGLGFLYSLTFGNIGTVYRQRAQLLPSLLIFAMAGYEHRAMFSRTRSGWRPRPD